MFIKKNSTNSITRITILTIAMNIHKGKLLEYIEKNKVVTSSDVAKFLKVSWNTADKYMLELVIESKVDRIKKAGVNLWIIK